MDGAARGAGRRDGRRRGVRSARPRDEAGFGLMEKARRPSSRWPRRAGSGWWRRASATPRRRRRRGTGELIVAAVEHGAQVVLVAAGGSATTDGGLGAIEAICGGRRPAWRAAASCCATCATPFQDAARVFAPAEGR